MKFTLDKKVAIDFFKTIDGIAKGGAPIAAYDSALLEADPESQTVRVTATDLQMTARRSCQALVNASTKESFCIDAKRVLQIVKSLKDGDVVFEYENDKLTIKSGRTRTRIQTLSADDFPESKFDSTDGVPFDLASLSDALKRVTFSMSTDSSRPQLCSVNVNLETGGYRLTTTDGHRLSSVFVLGASDWFTNDFMLSPGIVRFLEKLEIRDDMRCHADEAGITLISATLQIHSANILGNFPDFKKIIPKKFGCSFNVPASDLHDALKRVALFAPKDTKISAFSLVASEGDEFIDTLRISVPQETRGSFAEDVSAILGKGSTESLETSGASYRYILEASIAAGGIDTLIEMNDPLSPIRIRECDEVADSYWIVMPCRI